MIKLFCARLPFLIIIIIVHSYFVSWFIVKSDYTNIQTYKHINFFIPRDYPDEVQVQVEIDFDLFHFDQVDYGFYRDESINISDKGS
jgi:hypothetical protein